MATMLLPLRSFGANFSKDSLDFTNTGNSLFLSNFALTSLQLPKEKAIISSNPIEEQSISDTMSSIVIVKEPQLVYR